MKRQIKKSIITLMGALFVGTGIAVAAGWVTCTKCAGRGKIECYQCNGSGKAGNYKCGYCGGSGLRKCSSCGGTEQVYSHYND